MTRGASNPRACGFYIWKHLTHNNSDGRICASCAKELPSSRSRDLIAASPQSLPMTIAGIAKISWETDPISLTKFCPGPLKGIHRWPVNSPYKGPVTQKLFPNLQLRPSLATRGPQFSHCNQKDENLFLSIRWMLWILYWYDGIVSIQRPPYRVWAFLLLRLILL